MTQWHSWWQSGVIYQIYPRSFFDSNRDGVGDLPGSTRKLDYLKWLGVDAVWISPVYPSPMADFGYDISDYTDVHPLFGTLQDMNTLLHEAHQRNLKVILDFVPNHTSDAHPWFQEARSSRTNEKRDWYMWYDPDPDGGPPNNWTSYFGGSAWQFDQRRIATRVGREQARVAQMLLLTLRGTPTCYYGNELRMQNVAVPPELMHDPPGKDNPEHSRDPERTPMQWDSSPHASSSCANTLTNAAW